MEEEVHFSEGQEVEVRGTEEGLRESWFVAKVVRVAPKRSKKKRKVLVEYETLVGRKTLEPLRDYIEISNLRPQQPNDENRRVFGLNEVVDAYYNDGWWQGVINEVLENSRYVVYFGATDERIEFGAEKLRVHREWIDGRWVTPQEQEQQIMEPRFKKGTPVEISFDDESCRGAWFPATVLEENSNESFLVEYGFLRPSDKTGTLTETVDSLHIRPSHSQNSEKREFEVSEDVEAFCHFAWWSGIVTKVLADNRYIVFIKDLGELKEFNLSELRLHMDSINGEWVQGFLQDTSVTPCNQGNLRTPDQENMWQLGNSPVSNQTASQSNAIALLTPKSPTNFSSHDKRLKKGNETEAFLSSVEGHASAISIEASTKREEIKTQIAAKQLTTPLRRSKRSNRGNKYKTFTERSKAQGESIIIQSKGMFSNTEDGLPNLSVRPGDSSPTMIGFSSDNQLTSQSNKASLQISSGLDNELQKSFVAKCSFALEEHRDVNDKYNTATGDEQTDIVPQPIQMDSILDNEMSLPFIKSSPLWEVVESMDIFRSLPQQPHFRPLKQLNGELCEGIAIGHMINFANIVSKLGNVRLNEPRSVLEDKAKALSELEAFGFRVNPVQARLEKLLRVKDSNGRLAEEAKIVDEQIGEKKHEAEKLKSEIDEIKKKLRLLQESLEAKGSNIGKLQEVAVEIKEKVRCIQLDFDEVAAAPW